MRSDRFVCRLMGRANRLRSSTLSDEPLFYQRQEPLEVVARDENSLV